MDLIPGERNPVLHLVPQAQIAFARRAMGKDHGSSLGIGSRGRAIFRAQKEVSHPLRLATMGRSAWHAMDLFQDRPK